MNENTPLCKSCVNRSPNWPPSREQCVPVASSSLPATDEGNPALQIDESLNQIYEARLAEINEQANGDAALKEITYKEWVDMLRQINLTLVKNIQEMERETKERLNLMERLAHTTCRFGPTDDLCKCRRDLASLIQLIRNASKTGDWSVDRYKFETITEQDIFGNDKSYLEKTPEKTLKKELESNNESSMADPKVVLGQKSKLIANVKALAIEVADKHDEIRDLKKQVLSLEDEIQKAQKKIQLKDDVIRELRNDLKALPKSPKAWGPRISYQVSPTLSQLTSDTRSEDMYNLESTSATKAEGGYSNRDSCCLQMEGLWEKNDDEDEDEELRKSLQQEFCRLFEIKSIYDQNIEEHRREIDDKQRRICEKMDKLFKNNNELRNSVKVYRQELQNLENPQSDRTLTLYSDGDSGISSDLDQDVKLVNSVRNRVCCLIEENQKLRKEGQCFQIKCEDASSKAKAKSELLEKSSKALREVADSLTTVLCKPVAYDKIFDECETKTGNPIVAAVGELVDMLDEKEKTINELKQQIACNRKTNADLECNSHQLETELCELKHLMAGQKDCPGMLFQNQEFAKRIFLEAEKYRDGNFGIQQENNREYLRIIDDLSSELNTLSTQVNMVQSEFPTDEIAKQFENSLKVLEKQNDILQAAVERLVEERMTVERTLQTKNEELKKKFCEQEKEICALRSQIAELQRKPCERCAAKDQSAAESRENKQTSPCTSSSDDLNKLESELRIKASVVEGLKFENVKLKEELADLRRHQAAKQKLLQRRCASFAGKEASGMTEAAHELDVVSQLNTSQEQNQEQSKSLQRTAKEVVRLKQVIEELQANEEAYSKERNLLQDELISIKERQASQCGIQKSLQDQLQGTIDELYVAKEKLFECRELKAQAERLHRAEMNNCEEYNAELVDKFNKLVEHYNELKKQNQKLVQIDQERNKQIRAFNTWKEEQIKVEKNVRAKTQKLENHIREMLEEKQCLLDRLHETENDNRTMVQVMERSGLCAMGTPSINVGTPSRYPAPSVSAQPSDPVSKVIDNARSTSRRLFQQRSILEDEANRCFPKSK